MTAHTNYDLGKCIRCKKDTAVDVMCKGKGQEAFSFNMCELCMIATTPGVTRLRGNGDIIYEMNHDMPKNMFINLKDRALNPNKDEVIQKRSEEAKVDVLKSAKSRCAPYLFLRGVSLLTDDARVA
jgi:glutaredoxin